MSLEQIKNSLKISFLFALTCLAGTGIYAQVQSAQFSMQNPMLAEQIKYERMRLFIEHATQKILDKECEEQ